MSVLWRFCCLALAAAETSPPPISVFGHLVPDTDTVSAAIVYAWELTSRGVPAKPFRLGELNPETAYVLERFGQPSPELLSALAPKGTVAIVDTNNPKELPEGLEAVTIHSIVDHHKLSGLTTSQPIEVDMRPICSATSILYARAKSFNLVPPRHIAGLMLAGILSDSLGFRSPTTTAVDRQHARELGELLGDINVEDFTQGMLDAKANTAHLSPKELVLMDTKVFQFYGKKLRVSVVETTKAEGVLSRRGELAEAMTKVTQEEGLDDCLLFVVDILQEHAVFISASDTAKQIVETAWGVQVSSEGLATLPGVLSRKKQMLPKLEEAVKTLSRTDL